MEITIEITIEIAMEITFDITLEIRIEIASDFTCEITFGITLNSKSENTRILTIVLDFLIYTTSGFWTPKNPKQCGFARRVQWNQSRDLNMITNQQKKKNNELEQIITILTELPQDLEKLEHL